MSYPKAYVLDVEASKLLAAARAATGLTQEAVARRARTSQATLSAYEHGRKSPTLAVAQRILHAIDYELDVTPRITFTELPINSSPRRFYLPNRLWRLDPNECFAPVDVVLSTGPKRLDITDRTKRIAAYVWLIEHGQPEVLHTHLDAALLIEAWPEIAANLHACVKQEWSPLIHKTATHWFQELIKSYAARQNHTVRSRSRTERLARKLAARGLSREEIAKVLWPKDLH